MSSTLLQLSLILAFFYLTLAGAYERNDYKGLPVASRTLSGILHLDRWAYNDIVTECPSIGKMGFAAVQISPITAHAKVSQLNGVERLSVASYEIKNESGTEVQLRTMVAECKRYNVRILVDVVLNNMMRATDELNVQRSRDDIRNKKYGVENEPALYTSKYFHDDLPISETDYHSNWKRVREGNLDNLEDLKQVIDGVPNIQMFGFLYKLLSIGVAGFRILNADHMYPEELVKLFETLPDVEFETTPTRPFIYCDVYDPYHEIMWVIKDEEYVKYTRVTDYRFAEELSASLNHYKINLSTFNKFDIVENGETKTNKNLRPGKDSVVFLSTAMTHVYKNRGFILYPALPDRQFIDTTLTDPTSMKIAKVALAFMLTNGHGIPLITSSYISLTSNKANGAALVHRWKSTQLLMQWRSYILEKGDGVFPDISDWQAVNDSNQVAYCVGIHGFVVINHQQREVEFNKEVQTCFKTHSKSSNYVDGLYCDILSETEWRDGKTPDEVCNHGSYIEIEKNGKGKIHVPQKDGVQLFSSKTVYKKYGSYYRIKN